MKLRWKKGNTGDRQNIRACRDARTGSAMEQSSAANDVDSAVKQHTILLNSCGAETCQLIHSLVTPRKSTNEIFTQRIELVKVLYCLPPSVMV